MHDVIQGQTVALGGIDEFGQRYLIIDIALDPQMLHQSRLVHHAKLRNAIGAHAIIKKPKRLNLFFLDRRLRTGAGHLEGFTGTKRQYTSGDRVLGQL